MRQASAPPPTRAPGRLPRSAHETSSARLTIVAASARPQSTSGPIRRPNSARAGRWLGQLGDRIGQPAGAAAARPARRTLTDKNSLLTELEHVPRTGIATNDEELESALRSIAAPVRARSGQVVAAVNVAIPWSPAAMSELVTQLGPTIQATAREIA